MLSKFKKWAMIALCAAVTVGFQSCEDTEEPDADNNPPAPGGEIYDPATYTDKEYLENTANAALGLVNPDNHRELINLARCFADDYSDIDLPDNFYDDHGRFGAAARRAASDLERFNVMGRGATTFFYNMARYSGIYSADRYSDCWTRIGNKTNGVEFRFTDRSSLDCVISVTGSGSDWDQTVTIDGDRYHVQVPPTLEFTISRNGKQLAHGTIKTNFENGSKLEIASDITAADLHVVQALKGNNTKVDVSVNVYVGTIELTHATASLKGTNLCNAELWDKGLNRYEEQYLYDNVSGVEASATVMNQVTVKSTVTNVEGFCENFEGWWDSWDYSNPEQAARAGVAALNRSCRNTVHYAGSDEVRAVLNWEPYLDWSYYNDWSGQYQEEWGTRTIITFASDGASYNVESYFNGSRFASVEDLFENLYDRYDGMF